MVSEQHPAYKSATWSLRLQGPQHRLALPAAMNIHQHLFITIEWSSWQTAT